MDTTVRFYLKTDEHTLEPFASNKAMVNRFMSDSENWCNECMAVVEYESKLDATGIVNVCPFCHSETVERVEKTVYDKPQ